ncbi:MULTISPECIES: pyrroline-5-carboxylate reductase [unclassified Roseateles]|uniref:pyrroline-5-carboxylate reductase n=1 Tax=unclassified Roseateles TaxID=2626991 RepID=UPI000700CEC1|nr:MULTISPECIES: pyrroline-5-carboxylate reductase [unclassified Roseateles]KQW45493.1 pyrroline-5-carboxylate reductase [Pelomonas sp. Root405]KRA72337.1 pyrroline-5-carboxylate reductase [Pelomonas sp. Root662]
MSAELIAFIGGGNMASAIIGGLLRAGMAASRLVVVEPHAPQRDKLVGEFGIAALAAGDAVLAGAGTVVWAVKPQLFGAAAEPVKAWVGGALQLSVMAGIRSDAIVAATGSERIVRAMPNTPALIGKGIAGLYGRPAVSADERTRVERLLAPTGQTLWVDAEDDLDAVTALSGSGPAYFFFFVEAMMAAAVDMGLTAEQGRRLALATCGGAAALGLASDESPTTLRERVTSKGGTTHAAITSMQADAVDAAIRRAVLAAQQRAAELGKEFG